MYFFQIGLMDLTLVKNIKILVINKSSSKKHGFLVF